jgi:hypothetical protein
MNRRCKMFPKKATFFELRLAKRALARIWSHTTEPMTDLHTYECPNKLIRRHWHVGHKSYFEKAQVQQAQIQPTVSTPAN